ncbi:MULTISPECIES: hypothetical protein [Lactobacillus]|uniref:Uncharacterized protein n=1 Tax=Lactobacillus johnsonii TaxID=33959 RepID=A0A9X5AM70_LACJH|nr:MULTISPECIES: hypothetical protein [Lactobacillus]MTE03594.1 hypothetical protein [Lactobacillus johnsonii]
MDQIFITINKDASDGKLCGSTNYKGRKLLVRQVQLRDQWLAGYVQILPVDTIYQRIKDSDYDDDLVFLTTVREVTFVGEVILDGEKLDGIFIGVDYNEPFLRNTTINECLKDLQEIVDEIKG